MFLAQSSNALQAQIPFYVNILEDIISNNDTHEKESIDNAIFEAKDIALGAKEIFSVSNNHYFFITTLLTKYLDGLKSLTEDNFDNKIYREILEILA